MGEVQEQQSYNALAIVFENNIRRLTALYEKAGSWEKAWRHLDPQLKTVEREKEWKKLEAHGVRLLLETDPSYPRLLREIPSFPLGLYVRGGEMHSDELCLAIVGTRKVSVSGRETARAFAAGLARAGVTVVSGLALGADAAAHAGALDAGGRTIAVLANGLHETYPRQHEALGRQILERGGTLVSEYPVGMPPLPHRFIERNRIISGLCRGAVIVEAPTGSGALATARFAFEQNREVFVVPGPVRHPNYEGSHKLIQDGAGLVTSVDDILTALNIQKSPEEAFRAPRAGASRASDENARLVLAALCAEGALLDIDAIAEHTKLPIPEILRVVAELSVGGIIKESGGRYHATQE